MTTCYVLGRYQRQPEPSRSPPALGPPVPPSPRPSETPARHSPQNVPRPNGEAVNSARQLSEQWEGLRLCPITQESMEDPVMLNCGHLFENHAITTWLNGHHGCPTCRQPVTNRLPGRIVKQIFELGDLALRQLSELAHQSGVGARDVPNVAPTPSVSRQLSFFKPSSFHCSRPFMELKPDDAAKEAEMVRKGLSPRASVQRITFKDVSVTGGLVSYARINAFTTPQHDFEIFLGSDDQTALDTLVQSAGFTPNLNDSMNYKEGRWVPRQTFNKQGTQVQLGVFVARTLQEKQFAWELIKGGITVTSDRTFVQTLINNHNDWRQAVDQQQEYVSRQRNMELQREERENQRKLAARNSGR